MKSPQARTTPLHALFVTSLSSFLTPFMSSSISVAIPSIGAEFGADVLTVNLLVTVFLTSLAAFLLPFGRLADLYGRKKVFLVGVLGYTFFSLFSAQASSITVLILAYALQGVGGAMILSTSVAILTSAFEARERGKVLGINATAVYMGLSVGPFLGGTLTYNLGWRSIFGLNCLVGLVTLGIALTKLKGEWLGTSGEKFDLAGSLLSASSLTAIIYGGSTFSLGDVNKVLFFLGLVGIVAFILKEKSTKFPLLNIGLFISNRAFTFSNLAALINYSVTYATALLLSFYLQLVRHLDPQAAGLVLLVQPLFQVVVSPLAGRLSDRVEPRIVASIGMALNSVGLFIFALLTPQSSLGLVAGNLVLMGIGFGLFSSPNTNAVMSAVSRAHYGVAASTLGTMRFLGQAFSMAVSATVFAVYLKGFQIATAPAAFLVQSMTVIFSVFAVLSVSGVAASLARGEIHHHVSK